MPMNHPRINITLERPIIYFLSSLAKQEHKSMSRLTKELVLEALKRREDKALSMIADIRDIPKAKRLKHDNVWK